jgi:hypothetical protein
MGETHNGEIRLIAPRDLTLFWAINRQRACPGSFFAASLMQLKRV